MVAIGKKAAMVSAAIRVATGADLVGLELKWWSKLGSILGSVLLVSGNTVPELTQLFSMLSASGLTMAVRWIGRQGRMSYHGVMNFSRSVCQQRLGELPYCKFTTAVAVAAAVVRSDGHRL